MNYLKRAALLLGATALAFACNTGDKVNRTTPSACGQGQTECNGTCVFLDTNASNCGACGTTCAAGQSCAASACTCQSGYSECSATCVDLATDATNCGACGVACQTGQLCTGACQCQDGLTSCGSSCADLQSSGQNCGACGTVCGTGMVCSLGACSDHCADGLTQCGSDCVDLATSVINCGACGTQCAAGQVCSSGACGCPDGQALCNGACVVLDTNPSNCGACGNACVGGQACSGGTCGCPSGQTLCNGTCISTQSDPANCGYCGTVCASGQTCSAGVCAASGDAGSDSGTGVVPFEALSPYAYLRKVKNLLTGLAPTDQEVLTLTQAAEADRPALLRTMMNDWITNQYPDLFKQKMIQYFVNLFQQTGFNPTEDFKVQLLENGGFDFGPLGIYGDTAFPRMIQNLQEGFARTAWEFVAAGQPFTNVLTTQKFMMTTGLKSLYVQVEMPNDEPYNFSRQTFPTCTSDANCQTGQCRADTSGTLRCQPPIWKVNMSGTAIALDDTLNPSSSNYMIFSDERPVNLPTFELQPTCYGTTQTNQYTGYAQLFQRLVGFTPRTPFVAQPDCWEHMSKPVYSDSDFSDWKWVTISKRPAGERYVQPYDLPKLRTTTDLHLSLPRVGFFTTPAYLAIWNTNDSNQHRVTANQTLLVALDKSFTSANDVNPTTQFGLDDVHAVEGSTCYGCHKSLDPLRQFWATVYDFRDRNDFPTSTFGGATANPRPTTVGGALAFGNVNQQGSSLVDFGNLITQITESTSADPNPISRFALAMTQYLCYWANSADCNERDLVYRGVARGFQTSNYDFKGLVLDLLSSPLVTASAHTDTFDEHEVVISVSRRRQLCAALSNRLGQTDVCSLDAIMPFYDGFDFRGSAYSAQRSTLRIAGGVPADAFSRGSEIPVTPSTPTLFYRAASELLCEDVATRLVDTTGSPFSSSDVQGALKKMVEVIMGYTPSDPHHDEALAILQDNYSASGTNATNALRSTFSLACQSPTSLAFGL